jgi:spermidine synthase
VPKPGRVLVVGVGGGSVLKDFASRGWQVDAVEIDPVVVKVASEHFGLSPEDGQVFTMDGRRFVSGDVGPYDVIVLDAFGSSSIPFHLVTREVFGLIASRLAPGGLLAINVESDGWHGDVVRAVSATLRTRFAHLVALPAEAAAGDLGNVVLLASNARLEVRADCEAFGRGFARRGWANRFVPYTRGAAVLTDDLNPVDLWSERINVIAREDLHRYFDELRLKTY